MNRIKLIFFFFCITLSLNGETELRWLDIEIWCELEPLIADVDQEFPIPRKEALNRLLEEARIIFSYMIYGAEFTYTPSDKARQVSEIFIITPTYEIIWGDKNLKVLSSRVEEEKLFAKIRYNLEEFQRSRLEAWKSNTMKPVQGRGASDFFKGYTNKIKALEDGIKEGIREHLRGDIYNKPKKVQGNVLVTREPYTIMREGQYISNVRFKLFVRELTPYRVF